VARDVLYHIRPLLTHRERVVFVRSLFCRFASQIFIMHRLPGEESVGRKETPLLGKMFEIDYTNLKITGTPLPFSVFFAKKGGNYPLDLAVQQKPFFSVN
jgi:hypothetical protein